MFNIIYLSMEKQNECAQFVFAKIGDKYEETLPFQDQLKFSQILMGSLFIRGYRMFKKDVDNLCCIFYKRQHFKTEYLYLKYTKGYTTSGKNKIVESVNQTISYIDDMKGIPQQSYKLIIGYLEDCCTVQLNKQQYLAYAQNNDQNHQRLQWARPIQKDEQNMTMTSKDQLLKLKEIVWTYINTFGSKYKNNYYCDLSRRNPTTFIIDKLISTVNWIIYCETVNKPYNQIETANWTCFEMRAKQRLKPDRKDILLTGSGRTMMIHLLLLEKIENYKKEYETEVGEVIFEFRKSYLEGQVKAYEIKDELQPNNLIYKMKSWTIKQYSIIS